MFHSSAFTPLCKQCGISPRFPGHDFCGKQCAGHWTTRPTSTPISLCEMCKQRPKRVDNGTTHPYCGKACARVAAFASLSQNLQCKIRSCTQARHTDANGSSRYCSKSHVALGSDVCLQCRSKKRQDNVAFCTTACKNDALANSPLLLKVPRDHSIFQSVVEQFNQSWRHPTPNGLPTVRKVYSVLAPAATTARYQGYKVSVEARGQHASPTRAAGNENRRWHGTFRECRLGDKGHTQFCHSPACSLCCILKSSFDLSMYKKNTKWGRFGAGIYTSSTSSKANDYSRNSPQSSNLKALLLSKVVVGKGCKMKHDNPTLTAPPAGFDSVLAEVGGTLNYDEVIVYTNDAVRPAYLVMYEGA